MVDLLLIVSALVILGVVYVAAHFLDMQKIHYADSGNPVPSGKKNEWTHPFIVNSSEYGRLKSFHYTLVKAFGDGLVSKGIVDGRICLFTKLKSHAPIIGNIHPTDVILLRDKENKKLYMRLVTKVTDSDVTTVIRGKVNENIQTNVDFDKFEIIGLLKTVSF